MAILVFDDFNGSNGTDIADHAPDIDIVGGGWSQALPNEVELDGNGAVRFSGTGDSAWINTGQVDQIVRATINAAGADNRFQLVARSDNQDGTIGTNYSLNMRQGVSGSDNLFLYKRISGSSTLIASIELSFDASVSNIFELSVIGDNIVAKVDGVEVISTTDSSISSGTYAGFYHALYTDGNLRVYDFEVDDGISNPVSADINYTISAPTVSATASATLPNPVANASFAVNIPSVSVASAATLPQPASGVDFTVNTPSVAASASATLPGYNATVSFTVNTPSVSANTSATLPNPSADVSYTVFTPTVNASASATLPNPVSDIAFSVSAPSVAASAAATEPNFNSNVAFTVNSPTVSISASAALPQPESAVSFTVSPPSVSVVAIVGGIAIIVDEETNINQRVLSNNINAPILSNNING